MSIITKVLKQKAVYWAPTGSDDCNHEPAYDDFGKPLHVEPIEVDARWEDVREEVNTIAGDTVIARNKVMVSQDVALGGYLMFGNMEDVTKVDVPLDNALTHKILRFDKIPNFKCTEFLRVAYL